MNGNVIIPSEISKTKKNKEKLPKNLFGSGSIGEADENTDESEETDDTEEETTNETEEEMSNENIKEKQSNGEIVDPINNVKPQEFEGVSSVQIPKQKIKRKKRREGRNYQNAINTIPTQNVTQTKKKTKKKSKKHHVETFEEESEHEDKFAKNIGKFVKFIKPVIIVVIVLLILYKLFPYIQRLYSLIKNKVFRKKNINATSNSAEIKNQTLFP